MTLSKILISATFLALTFPVLHSETTYRIRYDVFYNNRQISTEQPVVLANSKYGLVTNEFIRKGTADLPFQESIIRAKDSLLFSAAHLPKGESIATADTLYFKEQQFKMQDTSRLILGHLCKRADISINSNRITVWYTRDLSCYASPMVAGSMLGLVLEYERNGDYRVTAQSLDEIPADSFRVEERMNTALLDYATYADRLWKSRFTTVSVFENAHLNFSGEATTNDTVLVFNRGIAQVKKLRMPLMKPGASVFLDVTQSSLGDAYDRTGTVFIIPSSKIRSEHGKLVYTGEGNKDKLLSVATSGYVPNIELMRFFTSFGAGLPQKTAYRKGKEWSGENFYRQEISEYAALLANQEVYIGIQIENYDAKGHRVDLNLTLHESDDKPAYEKVVPLFNTLNVFESGTDESRTIFQKQEGLTMNFNLDKDLHNAHIRFITTGHGGWENGDEFLRKTNTIKLNGKVVFKVVPWREDCGSYRRQNPKSGNFPNGLSSSDYSRSNWCPGTVTTPYIIELGDMKKGHYELQLQIPQGPDEGPSFSHWNVSGVLIGEE